MVWGSAGWPRSQEGQWLGRSHSTSTGARGLQAPDVNAVPRRAADQIRTHDAIPLNFTAELIVTCSKISIYLALRAIELLISYGKHAYTYEYFK